MSGTILNNLTRFASLPRIWRTLNLKNHRTKKPTNGHQTNHLRIPSPTIHLQCSLSSSFNLRLARQQLLGQASQLGNGATSRISSEKDQTIGGSDQLESSASEILERSDSSQLLSRIDLHSSEARHAVSRCEEDQMINCDPNFPYRHADGRCNNLQHPTWGKANTCFARLLPPDYSDGQSAPRISVTGHPLPNPRILSAIVHRDFNYPATYTHFVMQYGQFFAHDIAFTPSSRTSKYSKILSLFLQYFSYIANSLHHKRRDEQALRLAMRELVA